MSQCDAGMPFTPYYDQGGITIYNADCRKVLPFLERFDLLLTDPPYGLGDKWKRGGWKGTKNGEGRLWTAQDGSWDMSTPEPWLISQAILMVQNSIIWGGNYFKLSPTRGILSWDKIQDHSGSEFEFAWSTLDMAAKVFRMSRVDANINCRDMPKMHPTEKPLALMRWCLGLVPDAQTVLDPFMGSGTTLVAARLEGRKAVGIEINEKYCEAAVNRLRQRVLFAGEQESENTMEAYTHAESV